MIKALIFDCFGVIIGRGFEATYRIAGSDPRADRPFIDDMLGQANLGLISEDTFNQAIAKHLGITLQAWHEAIHKAEQPDTELLSEIKRFRMAYKTALLSNSNHGVAAQRIGEARLNECFDEVIVSAEVGLVKPDPSIYEYTFNKLNVAPSECVFIDDREVLLVTARQLGAQTVLYKDLEQTNTELEQILAHDSKS